MAGHFSEPTVGNPRITLLLRGVTWVEVSVLTVTGLGLLCGVAWIVSLWPWPLKPFNQRFLGAVYSGALVAAAWQAIVARWAPARTVTWMVFVFTLVVIVLSFVHLNQFDFGRMPAWIWFALYIGVCLNAGAHLLWPRGQRAVGRPAPARWRPVLWLQAGGGFAIGLAHLIAPAWVGTLWPWPIDAFHAQLYSVCFLTPATGALCLERAATGVDWKTMGSTQFVAGLLPILGLVLADASAHRVVWTAATTWLWIAMCAAVAAIGLAMWRESGRG